MHVLQLDEFDALRCICFAIGVATEQMGMFSILMLGVGQSLFTMLLDAAFGPTVRSSHPFMCCGQVPT